MTRRRLTLLLPVVAVLGVAACGGGAPAEDAASSPASLADAAAFAGDRTSSEGAAAGAREAASAATLFTTGADGLLHAREVELPDLANTRVRAEALVQRVVAESGTFPKGCGCWTYS